MKRTVVLPGAELEMLEAAQYYEDQAIGLGGDYLAEVDRLLRLFLLIPKHGRYSRVTCAGAWSEDFLLEAL